MIIGTKLITKGADILIAIRTTIKLKPNEIKQLQNIFKSENIKDESWEDIELIYEDDNYNINFIFVRLKDRIITVLKLFLTVTNKETGKEVNSYCTNVESFKDVFKLYLIKTDSKVIYNIYLKPENIIDKYFYEEYMNIYFLLAKNDFKSYKNYIELSSSNFNNNYDFLWTVAYSFLLNIRAYMHNKDFLNMLKNKLDYYGFVDEISPKELKIDKKAESYKDVETFNKFMTGILVYTINKMLENKFDTYEIRAIIFSTKDLFSWYSHICICKEL